MLTRLTDTNNDGVADCFDTMTAARNHTGHPHEFTFGPVRDREQFPADFMYQLTRQEFANLLRKS
jgi:hypothetical protein